MGNGLGTALANRVAAHLGGVADEVALMQVDTFGPLGLVSSGDPFTIDQKTQDAGARNPRWVPATSSATAASTGAHVATHPAAEAARVIFRFASWPACGVGVAHRAQDQGQGLAGHGGRTGGW
jgi:hypothetical protein